MLDLTVQDTTTRTQQELDAQEVALRYDTTVEACKTLNGIAAICLPKIMEFLFPPLFVYFWNRCTTLVQGTRGFPKFALGIPRGHAKTMFLKLFCVFIILFTKRKFILVICASQTLADALIDDVVDILSSNNIRRLFGDWNEHQDYDRADGKRFTFRGRVVILKARGQGSSFRGVAERNSRPDVMIFDDAQTKECAESKTQAKAFIEWFRGTAMKAKDPKFCFYLYVGNMYRKVLVEEEDQQTGRPAIYGCNLKNLKLSKYWESIIVGAILANGTALWEDLQPLEQLLEEYEEDKAAGVVEVFLAEVMNDDEAFNPSLFNPTLVPDYPYPDSQAPEGACFIIDPSLGKAKSDKQVVGLLHVIDGRSCLVDLQTYQMSGPRLVQELLSRCLEENVTAIAIENYAYQESLGQWFEHYIDELGIDGINVLMVNHGQQSKVSSILSMFKECMQSSYHGPCELYLHPRVRGKLYSEIKVFDPLRSDNEDGNLDVASYCNKVRLEHGSSILAPIYQMANRNPGVVIDTGMTYQLRA